MLKKPEPDGLGRDYWVVEETGDYALDNELGERLAVECANSMREMRDPHLLLQCVRSMAQHGRFGGVEVGFLFSFGWWVMRGGTPTSYSAMVDAQRKDAADRTVL